MVGRVSSLRFVGRREELAALEAAAAQASEGLGSVVLLSGEAGMGKSRLLSELAQRVADEMTVVVGECLPLAEGELPYAPVVAALRSLARQRETPEVEALLGTRRPVVAGRVPELSLPDDGAHGPVSGEMSQGHLFERLLALFVEAARTRPLVLVVEDFQWVDRSTRDFLAFLVRATRREPIALIVSYRSDELRRGHPLRPFVLELERSGRATRVELGPFTRSELGEQVGAILDDAPSAAVVDDLLARSEGNPFFTEELLVASRRADERLSESLRDTLLARVECQRSDVREVLRIAAVTGRTVDHALLAAATDLAEDDLNEALREAVEDYLLAPDALTAGYSFRHALLREAIYFDLLPGERQSLHLRLAQLLGEQSGTAPVSAGTAAEVAHHFYAAGELPRRPGCIGDCRDRGRGAPGLLRSVAALRAGDRDLGPSDTDAGGLPLDRIEVMRRAARRGASDRRDRSPRSCWRSPCSTAIDERQDPVAGSARPRASRPLSVDRGSGRGRTARVRASRRIDACASRRQRRARWSSQPRGRS